MSAETKEKLHTACLQYVEERLTKIDAAIKDLEDALKLETKCSMGDKYETGRAMLHLEFEKLSGQHEQYQKLRKTVRMLDPKMAFQNAGFGAVVETGQANYFIAIPAGEINLEEGKFYAVGAGSPIAMALSGKAEGDEVSFNGKTFKVTRIY
ncbi:transcription elongation factor [Salinimicrobium catena]|uniref:transcription elongation factor n=1 Tax=Salinimicrobium catena TaxID=390640 RepID=UPI002FE46882